MLAIRNGEKPRPQEYWRSYWDFVAAGDAAPRPAGPHGRIGGISSTKAGFTEAEFDLSLTQAQRQFKTGSWRWKTQAMKCGQGRCLAG